MASECRYILRGSVQEAIQQGEGKEVGICGDGEAALECRLEEERVDQRGPVQPKTKCAAQCRIDDVLCFGPGLPPGCLRNEWVQRQGGADERHGHAVARERRNHGKSIAQAHRATIIDWTGKRESGHGTSRAGADRCRRDPFCQ